MDIYLWILPYLWIITYSFHELCKNDDINKSHNKFGHYTFQFLFVGRFLFNLTRLNGIYLFINLTRQSRSSLGWLNFFRWSSVNTYIHYHYFYFIFTRNFAFNLYFSSQFIKAIFWGVKNVKHIDLGILVFIMEQLIPLGSNLANFELGCIGLLILVLCLLVSTCCLREVRPTMVSEHTQHVYQVWPFLTENEKTLACCPLSSLTCSLNIVLSSGN